MMEDADMSNHVRDMLGKMKYLMEDYGGMLNSMKDAQTKGNK